MRGRSRDADPGPDLTRPLRARAEFPEECEGTVSGVTRFCPWARGDESRAGASWPVFLVSGNEGA
jgi:hypothetical protein